MENGRAGLFDGPATHEGVTVKFVGSPYGQRLVEAVQPRFFPAAGGHHKQLPQRQSAGADSAVARRAEARFDWVRAGPVADAAAAEFDESPIVRPIELASSRSIASRSAGETSGRFNTARIGWAWTQSASSVTCWL